MKTRTLIKLLLLLAGVTCVLSVAFQNQTIELKIINAIYQLVAVYFLVKFKIARADPLKLRDH